MADETNATSKVAPSQTVEAIRSERYPDLDPGLVLEILRLHAEKVPPENLARQIDEALAKQGVEDGSC